MAVELKPMEQLAIAQALQKRIGEIVSTKDPGNLRGQVDAEIRDMYEKTGAKSFDVRLLGRKVGTYSVTVTKPKPQAKRVELAVENQEGFRSWCEANGFMRIDTDAVMRYFDETGDIPSGCITQTVIEPEIAGGQVSRTTLKVDPEMVADTMRESLGEYVTGLLEGETL